MANRVDDDIRWCGQCREGISEDIFARVPALWPHYREGGKVDKRHEVFDLVQHQIPTFLECTLSDELREHFKVNTSTGQGVVARSPRYSFPTMGTTKKGIFVCSQYDAEQGHRLGDYRISIIVGRDGLRHHTANPARALRELVTEARTILDVGARPLVKPQGSYDKEIVHQISFPLRNAPTAGDFRRGLNLMLQKVADHKTVLDSLWYEILRRAKNYEPEPIPEEIHRRGQRGEEYVIARERNKINQLVDQMNEQDRRALCMELGISNPVDCVRKITPYEANHDICTLRFVDGNPRRHYVHWIEVKTTGRGIFHGTMSRKQSQFALKHPGQTSLVVITRERKDEAIKNVQEISSMSERSHYLHHEVRSEYTHPGVLTGS